MSCPRCGLVVPLRAPFLALNRCPRCLARARISVPMFQREDERTELLDETSLASLVIRTRPEPGRLVIALHGELDLASAPALQRQLDAAREIGIGRVVIDMSELDFLDSTGLALLLYADRRLRENDQELCLRRGPRAVQKVFELTRALSIFRFED